MSLLITIPVINQPERLFRVLEQLNEVCVLPETELHIVDNASVPPIAAFLTPKVLAKNKMPLHIDRYDQNQGIYKSLAQTAEMYPNKHIVFIHYDVLIWEKGFDALIEDEFEKDPQLGLCGLVGAPGVHPNGGRIGTTSRLLGKEWGGNGTGKVWTVHGGWTPDNGIPCAVLDGCGMFFRAGTIPQHLDLEYKGLHHAYDVEFSLSWLAAGWRIKALPIQADHAGGTAGGEEIYGQSAKEVGAKMGFTELPKPLQNWDQFQYQINFDRFTKKWSHRLPVFVDKKYNVNWSS